MVLKDCWKFLLPVVLGIIMFHLDPPTAMPLKAWQLFSIFVPTILAFVLSPLPMGGIAILSLLFCSLTGVLDFKTQALSGFSSTTPWLIVSVFFIARAFIKAQLGTRLAYLFVKMLGSSTLGLAYGISFAEVLIAPFIPSNTARCGGIMLPILKSISQSLGSSPEQKSERLLGSYLFYNSFNANLITSCMFLTAMSGNPLSVDLAACQGIKITWGGWLLASCVPAIACLILVPLLLYVIYPPQQKKLYGAKDLASQTLKEMGSLKRDEWIMIVTFGVMLFLWTVGESHYKIHPAIGGLVGVSILLLTNVLTFDDLLNEKEAWHTLLWISILIMMSTYLGEFGFVKWFATSVKGCIHGYNWGITLFLSVLIFFYAHYMFASQVAHLSALYAGILTVTLACGTPPLLTALVLAFSTSLSSVMTHYGTSAGSILFGTGYVTIKEWWGMGFLLSLFYLLVWGVIGGLWWKVIGLW